MSEKQTLDLSQLHNNPENISKYLNEAIAGDELAVLVRAIGAVMRAQNVVALSQETGLRRENLYRLFAVAFAVLRTWARLILSKASMKASPRLNYPRMRVHQIRDGADDVGDEVTLVT